MGTTEDVWNPRHGQDAVTASTEDADLDQELGF